MEFTHYLHELLSVHSCNTAELVLQIACQELLQLLIIYIYIYVLKKNIVNLIEAHTALR